jgi:hypothetical protein
LFLLFHREQYLPEFPMTLASAKADNPTRFLPERADLSPGESMTTSPTTLIPAAASNQLPSLLGSALGGVPASSATSPFGAGSGFPSVGTFQAVGTPTGASSSAGQTLAGALTLNPAVTATLAAKPVTPAPVLAGTAGTAASLTAASTATAGSAANMGGMLQQMVLMILTVVMQAIAAQVKKDGGAGTASAPVLKLPPTPTPVAVAPAPAPVAAPAPAPTASSLLLTDKTADTTKKAQLDQSMAAIASDPDGAKLLAIAKAKGVTIEAGDPATAQGANDVAVPCNCAACQAAAAADGVTGAQDAGVIVNGVTLNNPQTGATRIVVRDASNIKTIVHELVHAVSTADGNSKDEEGIADLVGSRVANHLGGAAVGGLSGSDQQIFINKQQFYPTLKQTNDIRNTLAGDGISVSV